MSLKVYFKDINAPSPTQPFLPGACAIILNKGGQILLHKREDNEMWTLPGGKMEIGESISDCCIREIKEELGLKVKIKRMVGIYTSPDCVFDYGNGFVFQPFVVAFLCSSKNDNFVINNESLDARWFSKKEVLKLEMVPYTLQIINHSLHGIYTYFD